MKIVLDRKDGSEPLDVTEAVRILWDTNMSINASGSDFYDEWEEADLEALREAAGFMTEEEMQAQQEWWRAQQEQSRAEALAPVRASEAQHAEWLRQTEGRGF